MMGRSFLFSVDRNVSLIVWAVVAKVLLQRWQCDNCLVSSSLEVKYNDCKLFSYGIVRHVYLHHHCIEVSVDKCRLHYRNLWTRLVAQVF
jgi:hypothetical protein